MFERFTEKARRVVFFARYEASQFGSPMIDTEHLLLGLIREDKRAYNWVPKAQPSELRQRIQSLIPRQQPTSTALDLPLSEPGIRVLHLAMVEADQLKSGEIGTEHLFLALLQEDCATATVLLELGADLNKLRSTFGQVRGVEDALSRSDIVSETMLRAAYETITIHGASRNLRVVLGIATHYRLQDSCWRMRPWVAQDAVLEKKTNRLSLDLSLATDAANFELLKGGWKKDLCGICHWELFESRDDASHGTGYTNGRDWICTECYERFWSRPDFISGSYGEIT